MKKTLLFSLVIMLAAHLSAQDVEKKAIQISMVPPVSIGKPTDPYIYHSSLSVIAGYNYGVQGLEIGSVLNITKTDAGYAQFAGVANWVGSQTTGFQTAGVLNRTQTLKGLQMSGMANSADSVSGAQIAGAYNQTESLKGAQVSGFLNIAKSVNGIQLGIINIADTIEHGVSIGIVNVVKTGLYHFELSSNDITQVQLAFRSGGDNLYGIFYGGMRLNEEQFWTAGLGLGSRFRPVKNKNYFGTVEMLSSQMVEKSGSIGDELNILNRFSLNVGYQFNKRISVVGGPALNVYVTKMHDEESDEWGFDIGKTNLLNKSSEKTNIRMWLGYQVGFWF